MNNNENSIRQSLITVFSCAECGNTLNLSYRGKVDIGKRIKGGELRGSLPLSCADVTDGSEPTGAAMVKKVVFVEPCSICLKPAKELSDAVGVLLRAAKIND